MPLPRPHRRTLDLVKANLGGFGMLTVTNIIFLITYQAVYLTVLLPFMIVMFLFQFALFPLTFFTMGICAIIAIPLFLLFLVAYFALILTFASAMNGWSIYIARKVLDITKGRPIELNVVWEEITADWRYYLHKGAGMVAFSLLVITPVIVLVIVLPMMIALFIPVLLLEDPSNFMLSFILFLMIYIGGIMLVQPVVQFIFDAGSLKIAQGMGAWEGLFEAVKDMTRRRRLFGSYYVTMLLVELVLLILFPIASFGRWVLPIATKAFIVANDDL